MKLFFGISLEISPVSRLIDTPGNHLIAKRIALGRPNFRAVVMPARLIPQFLIHWEVRDGRRWRPIAAEEILSAIEGTYPQPDGRILDAAGNLLDRVPR